MTVREAMREVKGKQCHVMAKSGVLLGAWRVNDEWLASTYPYMEFEVLGRDIIKVDTVMYRGEAVLLVIE